MTVLLGMASLAALGIGMPQLARMTLLAVALYIHIRVVVTDDR